MAKTSSTKTGQGTGGKHPRGLRNNNPLNIRRGVSKWKGLRDFPTDKEFCEFESMDYGFRAAFITLRTYYTKHGCKTLRAIINRWAPPTENDTTLYSYCVAVYAGIRDTDSVLPSPTDRQNISLWADIMMGMAKVENGTNEGLVDACRRGIKIAFG